MQQKKKRASWSSSTKKKQWMREERKRERATNESRKDRKKIQSRKKRERRGKIKEASDQTAGAKKQSQEKKDGRMRASSEPGRTKADWIAGHSKTRKAWKERISRGDLMRGAALSLVVRGGVGQFPHGGNGNTADVTLS